jgi:protein-glutamine gamma-glutamyltransferase
MLNTPPFLIGAALLLWGWRTGWWFVALPLAIIFEASRFLKLRWEFTDKEYSRIFDVCTVLFGGAVVYLRFKEDITRSGFVLFQWGPVLFALMLMVQAYGSRDKIPYHVFSWFMRLRHRKEPMPAGGGLNISWCYFGVCLLAAGATNEPRDSFFYPIIIALCAWAAWFTRVRRYSLAVWASCAIAAAALGFVGQLGWVGFQNLMTPLLGQAFARFGPKEFDSSYARTTMGEVGSKKTSGKIVLRVKAERGRVPHLLRQANYDTLKDRMWVAARRDFVKVQPENDTTTWTLQPDLTNGSVVRISGYLRGGKGLISLPHGALQIRELPVLSVETTQLGVARATNGPGVVSYLAEFKPGKSIDEDPVPDDSVVPNSEKVVLAEIAEQIRPTARSTNDADVVQAVENYFTKNFSYSLYHKENVPKKGTALSHFLKTTHTGHCEYFATATTLLLRQLGIPARYTVGYSVQESKGDTFIVRERHGHAWVLAWIGGVWREVDTTPGSWFAMESEQASKLEAISDFFSNLWFNFSKWRWLGQKGFISRIAPVLVLPLVAVLVWRIFIRKKRVQQTNPNDQKFNWPGLDSEYYQLEARLAAAGHERHPHETPAQWLDRLKKDGITHPSLPALVDLHYRYRFDPRGLASTDRRALRSLAETKIDSPTDLRNP